MNALVSEIKSRGTRVGAGAITRKAAIEEDARKRRERDVGELIPSGKGGVKLVVDKEGTGTGIQREEGSRRKKGWLW